MKQIFSHQVFLTLLIVSIALSALNTAAFASTTTSNSYRIARPQVIMQNGSAHTTITSIQQRTSSREAQEFYDNGIVILYGARTGLNTTIGTQLVELDQSTIEKSKIPLHISSKSTYEFIHVRRGADLHRSVLFDTISQFIESGIRGSIHVSVPPELQNKKSYLGTLKVIFGAY